MKQQQPVTETVQEQVEKALDGRTRRWLSLEAKIPESELSRKMNEKADFSQDEIDRINAALKANIKL